MSERIVIRVEGEEEYYLEAHCDRSLTSDQQVELVEKLEEAMKSYLESQGVYVEESHKGS